jgi:hypothetical protein
MKAVIEQNNIKRLDLVSNVSGRGLGGVFFQLKNDSEEVNNNG